MSTFKVECSIIDPVKLSPFQPNSVIITVNTISEDIFIDQTTGHRTLRSTPVSSPPLLINLNLRSSSHHYIRSLLHDRFVRDFCLCDLLAPVISTTATDLGFGQNSFTFSMAVTVTYQTVLATSNDEIALRTALLGRIKPEELKSFEMETEPCSICLENLSGPTPSGELTRMTCSHVFHDHCLVEWLKRKNTCPLCRTVLYDK